MPYDESVYLRARNQRRQPGKKVQRLQHHVGWVGPQRQSEGRLVWNSRKENELSESATELSTNIGQASQGLSELLLYTDLISSKRLSLE